MTKDILELHSICPSCSAHTEVNKAVLERESWETDNDAHKYMPTTCLPVTAVHNGQ